MKTYQKIGKICKIENPNIEKIIELLQYNIMLCDNIFVRAAKDGYKYSL